MLNRQVEKSKVAKIKAYASLDKSNTTEDIEYSFPSVGVKREERATFYQEMTILIWEKSGSCGHRWKQSDCANCIWYMQWETGPCWSWWMSVLKECIGDNPNLLFISDRHPTISMEVENEFPLAFHAPDAYEKLCQAGPQRWSRGLCPLVRYSYMTLNSVESVNTCSVIYRKEPVLKLAKTYRAMVQEWYYKRQQLAANMTYEITDWAANKVAKKG
uniref:Transposase, MuDR, MULE transposase domain protein n=1 Tax=Tanacetum cinerariifolium TaxID=118510 RepID=A0A6L2M1R2_TANCI|nr:transposase, MuDR, MULE transposase domain protein [Tanacetum cinerariifolium]